MQRSIPYFIVFIIITTVVVIASMLLLVLIIMISQRRHKNMTGQMRKLETDHQQALLKMGVEIQDQTLSHIARELHDNVSLSLVLAKVNLQQTDWTSPRTAAHTGASTAALITDALKDISTLSRSLNSDLIQQQGLLKALEAETERVQRHSRLAITMQVSGEPVYLPCTSELLAFRIVQEPSIIL